MIKSITLGFHSVGLDNEVCYKGYGEEYDEFLDNKPSEITINYQVVEFPDKEIKIGGHTYVLKDSSTR